MSQQYPVTESVYLLKGGESQGPFDIDTILKGIESGEFEYNDICLREGATETERLRDVLDWDQSSPGDSTSDDDAESETSSETDSPAVTRNSRIIYRGHPSLISYPLPFFCLIGGIVGGAWASTWSLSFLILGLAISLIALAFITLKRLTQEYLITPQRIELLTGLISRSSKEVRIDDLRAINISCRGLLGAIGVGSLEFITTGDEPEVTFQKIWAAKKVKGLVRRLQDAA